MEPPQKALTLWQPYATLLAVGVKIHETRSWKTEYRGPLYIHAALKSAKKVRGIIGDADYFHLQNRLLYRITDLPRGCLIATVELYDCLLINEEFISKLHAEEKRMGNFALGGYAWQMRNRTLLPEPIEMMGRQGLWNVEVK